MRRASTPQRVAAGGVAGGAGSIGVRDLGQNVNHEVVLLSCIHSQYGIRVGDLDKGYAENTSQHMQG